MIELPAGYYLDNFTELVSCVATQYWDLLSHDEQAFVHDFRQLDSGAQKLYVRMLTRKGEVFRADKLYYDEISSTQDAALALANAQFIHINPPMGIAEYAGLFSKTEWLQLLDRVDKPQVKHLKLKQAKRAELDQALEALAVQYDFLGEHISVAIYRLANAPLFDTFKLLFFSNLHQDLSDFVLRDLGLYQFCDYKIDETTRMFESRHQIEQHLVFYSGIEPLEQCLQEDHTAIMALHQTLPKACQQDPLLKRRVDRVNVSLARQLERLNQLDEALSIYHTVHIPPSRERQSRIYAKQNNIEASFALCQDIHQHPINEEEAVFASEFAYRTAKKHKIDWPAPAKYTPTTEKLTLNASAQGVDKGVEICCADHYSEIGACYYVENGLFSSLFGLLYWDVLFAPVRGAFSHPFQIRPHDLYDPEFSSSRQTYIQQANDALSDFPSLPDLIVQRWHQHYATANPFVYWDALDEPLIHLAFERIPLAHWQAIFARLWRDLKHNRSGFPDLILFPHTGDYELIEVKAPGDRLQKNQKRWMEYFGLHAIAHKVVNVEWT